MKPSPERNYDDDILRHYDNWAVYLHEDQSYLGRNYVALNRGGEVDPFLDTTADERAEFVDVVRAVSGALDGLYQPTRLNYANLRNTWHHCHWHIVPRYEGDDLGLRIVDGFEFRDQRPGRHYAPSSKVEVPAGIFAKIQADMTAALA